jgi:hypothetical protein
MRWILAALTLGCGGDEPEILEDAPRSDATAGPDGVGVDAATGLFVELFGEHDPDLPGKSCRFQRDECRGASRLFVCLDDERVAVAEGTTCRACLDDEECAFEYYYFIAQGLDVSCGGDGLCHPVGADGVPRDGDSCVPQAPGWCLTARLGWFVCNAAGRCDRCQEADQCTATYGCSWICGGDTSFPQAGACVEPQPPPPGCF